MKKVIVYGAGESGKKLSGFCKYMGYDGIVCFADKRAGAIGRIDQYEVVNPEEALKLHVPFLIRIHNQDIKRDVYDFLCSSGATVYNSESQWVTDSGLDNVEWNRNYIAYTHIDDMNQYFRDAESESSLRIFWDESSVFRKMFEQLDLTNVIEIACGRGRHVNKYINKAGHVTLVDILQKNVDICKKRFADYENISYLKNDGFDLRSLSSNNYSSIFSYDSFVHFEMFDIYSYLKEFNRVLRKGGLALIHHSNYIDGYGDNNFESAPHARGFMSDKIFAYLATRAGFNVLSQKIIDWGNVKNLDCLSLIEKI